MIEQVTIDARYKGPPNSGNGGYSCGVMARHLDGIVEASLRLPPPLDTPLEIVATDEGVVMQHGETLVGIAKPATLDLDVPVLPDPLVLGGDPVDAPGRPKKFTPFGTCFVCGHDRTHPDGLCIHSKLVEGHEGLVASQWGLDGDYADESGNVAPEFIWSALDCPGYFACAAGEAALLGRLTAEVLAPLKAEGEATVIAWDLGGTGRKRKCGTAIYASDGTLVAKAEGLWIIVDPEKIKA
ncbi:hypothetical protein ACFO5Q_02805 [Kordiimonas lipolytica]|uniref:Uncharacterized protein n=1 Tax=Kordiimonas lipolytica TaxID=1662421 RepID=A0ABV8U7Z7_9PROT|nr:hypothetical protein [Kordiimonas lipolytica]